MAKIFLDANIFIDLLERKEELSIDDLSDNEFFISALSIHILFYVAKQKVPYSKLNEVIQLFSIVPLDMAVCNDALSGPTTDYEDNVQLHSAAQSNSDIFLTRDKKLIALTFFGKVRINSQLK